MSEILHFRGRIELDSLAHMLGPDVGHRYLAATSVAYDEATDISTVTLRAIMPDEYRERVMALVAGQQERERIRRVYNACR